MDQEKIWNYFQNNPEISEVAFCSDSRYGYISKRVASGTRVLNIGVGRGGLEDYLLSNEVDVYCLDPSEESINTLISKFGLVGKAKVGFSQSIPFDDDFFDVVIMSEVLEHLSDEVLQKTIVECHRVVRPGGKFIGTVPADEKLLENRVVCPDCGKLFHRWGHLQEFSYERLNNLLSQVFDNCFIVRKYFGNYKALNWKGKLSWIIKSSAVSVGVKGEGENYFF
jgi:SAM-dependent methyltransferase